MSIAKQPIYFISGLGADETVFERLGFDDSYELHYVQWLEPNRGESFKSYCTRLSDQIVEKNGSLIIGLSFGGIVAQEISKSVNFEKIILLSSVKSRAELPIYYRIIGSLGLYLLVPSFILKCYNPFTAWFFGANTKAAQTILKSFVTNVSSNFLKWAIRVIVTEKFEFLRSSKTLHLHGTKDRILPIRNLSNLVPIEGGGHLMTYTNSAAVNQKIVAFFKLPLL